MKALILAAGLGTRLLPYTTMRPKPLFTLGGTPVLEITINKLIQAGCTDIIINTHHLHEQIEKFIKKTKFQVHVETRHEPELLGTGGAIKNVQDFMKNSPFFVINSDIVSDIDLKQVKNFHIKGQWPATLVMHNYIKFNKVTINNDHFITGFLKNTQHSSNPPLNTEYLRSHCLKNKPLKNQSFKINPVKTDSIKLKNKISGYKQILAFTGIQLLSPEIFQYMPLKDEFSSIDLYAKLAEAGNYVKAYICPDAPYWNDIGTLNTYREACILHAAAPCLSSDFETRDPDKCRSKRHIQLPVRRQNKKHYNQNNQRHHQQQNQDHDNTHNSNILKKLDIRQLKGDGSHRKWFRVEWQQEKSCIISDHGICSDNINIGALKKQERQTIGNPIYQNHEDIYKDINVDKTCKIQCQTINKNNIYESEGKTREIDSFIAIGNHLLSSGIPVPAIMGYDLFSGMVVLEDLGDIHLQQVINNLKPEMNNAIHGYTHCYGNMDKIINSSINKEIVKWYQRICDLLIDFSIKGIKNFNPAWTFQTKAYTRELIIEKECMYFINSFIRDYLKKRINSDNLKETFEFIADNALRYSFTGLMHRDMQSRNIMIKNDEIFFIDFQAARKGPLQYDLASLLIDPYVDLENTIKKEILAYCALRINEITGFDKSKFIHSFKFCAIARNMQILGAFSYLSMVKGKKMFENYIPCALNNLAAGIKCLNEEAKDKLEPVKNILDKIK